MFREISDDATIRGGMVGNGGCKREERKRATTRGRNTHSTEQTRVCWWGRGCGVHTRGTRIGVSGGPVDLARVRITEVTCRKSLSFILAVTPGEITPAPRRLHCGWVSSLSLVSRGTRSCRSAESSVAIVQLRATCDPLRRSMEKRETENRRNGALENSS